MRALIVVDFQNDFITGSLGTPEATSIVSRVKNLVLGGGYDVVAFTKDTHYEGYLETGEGKLLPVEHCVAGTRGHDIYEDLDRAFPGIYVVEKETFGSEVLVNLIENRALYYAKWYVLDGLDIDIVGLCTDICVVANALLLKTRLYRTANINIIADCCAGTTPEKHEAALSVLESCQVNVVRRDGSHIERLGN